MRIKSIYISKWLVAVLALLIGVTITIASTFAWFTSGESKVNPFKTENLYFSVQPVDIFTTPDNWIPTDPKSKIVSAQNTGTVPAFVRILVLPAFTVDGTPLPANIGQQVMLDLNTTNWTDGGDGYYYYMDKLLPGNKAPNLFTTVTIPDSVANDPAYQNASFDIQIKVDAVAPLDFENAWWNNNPSSSALVHIDSVLQSKV